MDSLSIYLRDIKACGPLLTKGQEQELTIKASLGDANAKQILLEHNLPLVVSRAKRYAVHGIPIEDLIQEGNIGLLKAIESFNPEVGTRLSTYAVPKIDRQIQMAYETSSRIIKVSAETYKMIQKLKTMETMLSGRLYRNPNLQELAHALKITEEECDFLMQIKQDAMSLHAPKSQNEKEEEYLIEPSTGYLEEDLLEQFMKDEIINLLSILKEREQEIAVMLFGLGETRPRDGAEIGRQYNITRRRVHQIKATIIKKLRQAPGIDAMSVYMDNPEEAMKNLEYYREYYRTSTKRYTIPMERPKEYIKK